MIQPDPKGRLAITEQKSSRLLYILVTISFAAVTAILSYYWANEAADKRIYSSIGIPPLSGVVTIGSGIQGKIDRLVREPCYKDAAFDLAKELKAKGYPRESATLIISFVNRCPDSDYMLATAFNSLMDIGDYKLAKEMAERLVRSYPARSLFRYYLARAEDVLKDYSSALTSYLDSIQIEPEPQKLLGDVFYNTSRMYAELGRYCDAITPIETYISFDPANRANPQTARIISDYSRKGNCEGNYVKGSARIPIDTSSMKVTVTVNGIRGNFIFDTGASLVTVTSAFAERANIAIESGRRITVRVAGGGVTRNGIGYANTIKLGEAEAKGVVVGVADGNPIISGDSIDGLLGMSFLARFNVKISNGVLELAPIRLGEPAGVSSEKPWVGLWAASQSECSNQDGLVIELSEDTFDLSAFESVCKVRSAKQMGVEFLFSLSCTGEDGAREVSLVAQISGSQLRFTKRIGLFFQPNVFHRCELARGFR